MLEGIGKDITIQKKGKNKFLFCLYIVDPDIIMEFFG